MRGAAYYAKPIFGFLNIFDKKFLKAKGRCINKSLITKVSIPNARQKQARREVCGFRAASLQIVNDQAPFGCFVTDCNTIVQKLISSFDIAFPLGGKVSAVADG